MKYIQGALSSQYAHRQPLWGRVGTAPLGATPGANICTMPAQHLLKGRLCPALGARQEPFWGVLCEGSAGAAHVAVAHELFLAQLACWGAPTGQSSLPGLSAAADSFNVANTCSVHHTREPVDHKDCTSLYKKGRVTFWCIHALH